MGEIVGNTSLCSALMIKTQLMLLIHLLHPADAHDRCCGGGVNGPSIVNSRDRLSPTITTIIINVSFEKNRMNVRKLQDINDDD